MVRVVLGVVVVVYGVAWHVSRQINRAFEQLNFGEMPR